MNWSKGSKVRFLNKHSYDSQRKHALLEGLVEDGVYTVSFVDVGNYSSDVFLEGFNGGFNTVMFEEVKDETESDPLEIEVQELRQRIVKLEQTVKNLENNQGKFQPTTYPVYPRQTSPYDNPTNPYSYPNVWCSTSSVPPTPV